MIIKGGKKRYLEGDITGLIDSYLDDVTEAGDVDRKELVDDIMQLVCDHVRGALEQAWSESNLGDKLIDSL